MKRAIFPLIGILLTAASLQLPGSVLAAGSAKTDVVKVTPAPVQGKPAAASGTNPAGPVAPSSAGDSSENKSIPAAPEVAALFQKAGRYAELMEQWLKNSTPATFEPMLELGQEIGSAYMEHADKLDDPAFADLVKKMQGYLIIRDEIVVAAPDPAWLYEQAQKHGMPADIAFFDLMRQTLNGYWPVTMERLDDLSGCTRYGSGDLVRLYGGWKNFQQQYPEAYKEAIYEPELLLLWDVEDQLLNGNSACEGASSVMKEYEAFMQAYPQSELTPEIKKRLDLLRNNKLDMYFYQGVQYQPTE